MRTYIEIEPHLSGLMQRLSEGLAVAGQVLSASRKASVECETLLRLSDEELSALGLKRRDIARHVFEDILDV